MSVSRILFIGSIALFGAILSAGIAKKTMRKRQSQESVQEITLVQAPIESATPVSPILPKEPVTPVQGSIVEAASTPQHPKQLTSSPQPDLQEDQVDRIPLLFSPYGPRLSIVQTIRYTPRVNWVKDRPAWIVDYASHYQTSKHFISRSLTGKREYFSNEINAGDRFNVLRNDIAIEFYLLVDVSRSKMRFYYLEPAKKEMVLLKTYSVVLGRRDDLSPSGCLTPLGKYKLGSRIAVYKPGMMGNFHKQKVEMIQIFGTRWIPFDEEIVGCSAPAKGYGIHGCPWVKSQDGQWQESKEGSASYTSDGCIRLSTDDMEELFAIIVTRPTTIEIVREFEHAVQDARVVEPTIIMNSQ